MRQTFLGLMLLLVMPVAPALAQTLVAVPDAESLVAVGVGGMAASRTNSDAGVGGGLSVDVGRRRVRLAAEASVIRREGHNDWRALGGVRAWLGHGSRARLYVHGLAGRFIRSSEGVLALVAGAGVEIRSQSRLSLRLQADVVRETDGESSANGGRASVWLVVR